MDYSDKFITSFESQKTPSTSRERRIDWAFLSYSCSEGVRWGLLPCAVTGEVRSHWAHTGLTLSHLGGHSRVLCHSVGEGRLLLTRRTGKTLRKLSLVCSTWSGSYWASNKMIYINFNNLLRDVLNYPKIILKMIFTITERVKGNQWNMQVIIFTFRVLHFIRGWDI